MLRRLPFRSADDSTFRQSDKHRLTGLLSQRGCQSPDGFQVGAGTICLGAGKPAEFGGVHFESERRVRLQTAAAVGQHQQFGLFDQGGPRRFANRRCDDACLGNVHLVEKHQRIDLPRKPANALGQITLQFERRRRPVLGIEPVQFSRRLARFQHQRFAIDECPPVVGS